MRTPTCNTQRLAALFLGAVVAIAAWTAWTGASIGAGPDQVQLIPCPVRSVTGVVCPGCGMTRACVALAQGEVASAWTLHPFAFFLIPLALLFAFAPTRTRSVWEAMPRAARGAIGAVGIVACLGLWISRAFL